ncbi:MAG: RNA polymerase sigma factor [Gemmatimonadota bacterium]
MSTADSREFRTLMAEYTPRLLPVAASFADRETEAEDILQEVWIQVSRTMDRRPPDAPLGAWLYRITLNVGRSHRRRRRRREGLRIGQWGWWSRDRDETRVPTIEGAQAKKRIWQAIADLPDLQKEVILLRVVEERSTAEVAQILGRAEGTVKASLHRALGKLRNEIGERHDLRLT